jgi:AcrR family transcriptional regulator
MHPADVFVKNEYSVYYGRMPKVSDAHRESRREQILIAAWKCFSRNGFHSTSMADVIREAGLSAGAVYLYFRSKDDIIVAVATQVFGGIQGRLLDFAQQEPPPSPAEMATFLVRQPVLAREQAPADLFPLLLAVWSEATRNPALIEVAESILSELRTLLTTMLGRWVDAGGTLPMPAAQLTPVFLSLVQGFVVQHALSGAPRADEYAAALAGLFTAAGLGSGSAEPVRAAPTTAMS